MLTTPTAPLLAAVSAYLHDALGAEPYTRPWTDLGRVPYFLQDAFDLYHLRLYDRDLVLVAAREGRMPKLSGLRTQINKLADIVSHPVVFAADSLASYERKRLVEQRIPFVVPGNQLYLPDLGIDFREYFRQPTLEVTALTPATQALFITALLSGQWKSEWQPAEAITHLGYTSMTLSRAVRELSAAGLLTIRQEKKTRLLQPAHPPADAWQHAKPFLRSPVKRRVWISDDARTRFSEAPLAGLSALAAASMLADVARPIFAVSTAQWTVAQRSGIQALPESMPSSSQWEVWAYGPDLLPGRRVVDPLSLTLSLEGEADERVQQALEELRGQFPW